jgi:diaminopimelate decarboxylase
MTDTGTTSALALVAAYGSPLYRYDLDSVEAALADLTAALPAPSTLLYSLKANPHTDVVAALVAGGCHAEISSTGELTAALEAGCPPAHCLYTGPGKTAEEIATALAAGVTTFSVESVPDLHRVAAVSRGTGLTAACLLRVNGSDAPSGAGMRMTGESSQFGTDVETLLAQREELRSAAAAGAEVVGFHFYPLTNAADEAGLLAELLGSIATAARLARELGVQVRLLDLGGGFAAPFAAHGERPHYQGLREPLADALDSAFPGWQQGAPRVFFESGRHLVGDCGTLLCTVTDVKVSRGTRFAVLDTGINHLGGLSGIGRLLPLSADPVPADPEVADIPAGGTEPVRLVGPLCTPADTLGRGSAQLPTPHTGQLLAIPNVGAYGATASLVGFLSRPAAAEVVLRGGEVVSASRLVMQRTPVAARDEVPPEHRPVTTARQPTDGVTPAGSGPSAAAEQSDAGPWDHAFPGVLRAVLPRLGAGQPIGAHDSLRVAGLDSLALVELLVRLEEAYAVSIPDEALVPSAFATPGSLWQTLESARASMRV